MEDSQKDGSDSDWDSTLDFTSPRQVGIGQLRPDIATEIEEESALSEESDMDADRSLPNDRQVIRNVLKPQDDRPRAPSPNQKENNIVLAQKQQNRQQRREQPANHQPQQRHSEPDPPPYNFRDALPDQGSTEAATKGPPGKDRKGTTYDPAPSPSPRPVPKGSIRSIGSWDESDADADERTLREIRTNYQQEKQREEQKLKEEQSVAEEPNTARSESTWKGFRFGKKNKHARNNGKGTPQATPRSQAQPQSARSQGAPATTMFQAQGSRLQTEGQVTRQQATPVMTSMNVPPREEVASPSMIQVYDQRYTKTPTMPVVQYAPPQQHIQQVEPGAHTNPAVYAHPGTPITMTEDELVEEPRKLIDRDEDNGRYTYFFGHGNLRYYEVNEEDGAAVLPPVADKVDRIMQRVWQEIFAILRIIFSIVIWFLVELFKFLAKHIFQPLIIGVVMTFGDHVMKPLLSVLFNGFVQPASIFFWNMFTGMKHMFNPIGDILRRVFEQMAMLFRSIRLFDITWVSAGRSDGQNRIQSV